MEFISSTAVLNADVVKLSVAEILTVKGGYGVDFGDFVCFCVDEVRSVDTDCVDLVSAFADDLDVDSVPFVAAFVDDSISVLDNLVEDSVIVDGFSFVVF